MLRYGLLIVSTANLGDDIQSLAARQFLPRVDAYIDRDYLDKFKSEKQVKVIMNGWFARRPSTWPPSEDIEPLFVSVHISPSLASRILTPKTIEYLKTHEPIGARDLYTKVILEKHGVEVYFSGCLTLTLDYKYADFKKKSQDKILIVDLDWNLINYLPEDILEGSEIITHKYFDKPTDRIRRILPESLRERLRRIHITEDIMYRVDRFKTETEPIESRFKRAEMQIRNLATARLVITSRLHAALPALAFNTPVLFVHENLKDPRFSGLLRYLRHYTPSQFVGMVDEFNWENPPKNPHRSELRNLKRKLIENCTKFTEKI